MPRRVDMNQRNIIEALRDVGATVTDTHSLGKGFPDIVVGHAGLNYLFEIKHPENGSLTPDEKNFRVTWAGQADTITCWRDAFEIMGILSPEEKK
jgi:Holliday junction resolvase